MLLDGLVVFFGCIMLVAYVYNDKILNLQCCLTIVFILFFGDVYYLVCVCVLIKMKV